MLPSFIRRRNDSDEASGRHAYTPLQHVEENKQSNPLVDEVEEGLELQAEEELYFGGTQGSNTLSRVSKSLAFLVPSFLEPKRKEAKPLRSTAWLGNSNPTGRFDYWALTMSYRRSARNSSPMRRVCSRWSSVVFMGHPVSMDTRPSSAMVAVPTANLAARCLGASPGLCLLRRVRLHHITPFSNVGPPR